MIEKESSSITEYTDEVEDLFISFMYSKPDIFVRCKGILKPMFFDNKQNKETIDFMLNYSNEYAKLPSLEQIKAVSKKQIPLMELEAALHEDWFLKEFEKFAKHKSLREAILASPELLEKGRYGEVEANIKAAVQIGLVKDLGTDYYANPKSRLEDIRAGRGQISTGWKSVNEKLYGGINKGEITIFAGQCVTADTIVVAVKVLDLDEYFSKGLKVNDL